MKRKMLWSAVAAVPLLAVVAWVGLAYANAATSVKTSAKGVDCCLDPTCPPGCSEDCPPNCCDVASEKVTAKTAKKTSCCSEGSECCPAGEVCPDCLPTASAKIPAEEVHLPAVSVLPRLVGSLK